ncbi:MAG: DMT family transporter [Burkholderiales bacterium]|nr:DMT family transporter [Burkholderiales bacterium]
MPVLALDAAFLLAMGAAFSFACADMGMRSGLQHTNPFVGATITRSTGVVALLALVWMAGARFPSWGEHYLWLAVAGAFNPGLFSILFMFGIAKIGVARAAPIKGSSPLFAAFLAIFLLGERPQWYHLGGVVFMVLGIALISSGRTEGRWRRADALWPIAAAGVAALGAVFWRKALPSFPDALAGAFVGMAAAFALTVCYTGIFMRAELASGVRKAWRPFLMVGIIGAIGQYFFAGALQRGEIYRILPLIQTSPLITVAFALLFLRRVELITWRVPVGAFLTIGGAVLVNLRVTG